MELMVFKFLKGSYAIDLQKIKAILVYAQIRITPIHDEKPWISGLINLRGEVAPIVDLRIRFGEEEPKNTGDTVVIIVKTNEEKLIGIVVDKIEFIKEVDNSYLTPAPDLGVGISPKYITGLFKLAENELLTVLDIDKILNIQELTN